MQDRVDYRGKRAVDLVLAGPALLVLSPLLIAVAVSVKVTSRGAVLHRARRVGRGGSLFTLYKFRSMRAGAPTHGPGITVSGDERVTAVGRLIRATKIDELPQLWNVILGDMSLVGPRPEDPRYVEWYTAPQRRVLRWRPGITSPASVTYRNEARLLADAEDLEGAYRELMGEKLRIDLAYFEHASLAGDLRCIWHTLGGRRRSLHEPA